MPTRVRGKFRALAPKLCLRGPLPNRETHDLARIRYREARYAGDQFVMRPLHYWKSDTLSDREIAITRLIPLREATPSGSDRTMRDTDDARLGLTWH